MGCSTLTKLRRSLTRTTSRRSSFVMPERRLLVHTLDVQKVSIEGRSAVDKRRLAQETEREAEKGRKYKSKLTTRGDVMAIIELYNTHKIPPLAARLDAAEGALHYLTAPWWQRRLWDAKIIGGKVYKWLARRGIHLYTLDAEAGSPPEEGSTPLPKGAATAAGPR